MRDLSTIDKLHATNRKEWTNPCTNKYIWPGVLLVTLKFQRNHTNMWQGDNIPAAEVLIPPVNPEDKTTNEVLANVYVSILALCGILKSMETSENVYEDSENSIKKHHQRGGKSKKKDKKTSLSDDEKDDDVDKQAEIERAAKDRALIENELEKLQLGKNYLNKWLILVGVGLSQICVHTFEEFIESFSHYPSQY
eukprot:15365901-Ditylum_brightwellii.AAC.1